MESKKPSIRVSVPSLKSSISSPHHFLFSITVIITVINTTTVAPSQFAESYSKHCDQIVPASNPSYLVTGYTNRRPFSLDTGFFSSSSAKSLNNYTNTYANNAAYFYTSKLSETKNSDVLYLQSELHLVDLNATSALNTINVERNSLLGNRRFPVYREASLIYQLEGFWSSRSGKLCMVGPGSSNSRQGNLTYHNVVFKLDYPNATTLSTSLVNGVLESLDLRNDRLQYFEPIRVWGTSNRNYEFTLVKEESAEKFGDDKDNQSMGLAPIRDVCTKFNHWMYKFELDYSNLECDNCSPLGRGFDVLPKFMFFGHIRCSENARINFLIWFSDSSYNEHGRPFDNQTSLVAEGLWDLNKNLLHVVACRISYSSFLANASLEDCSFKLSLRFSPSLSLRNMSVVEGQMWNNISENVKDHSARVGFLSYEILLLGVQGLTYEYTEISNIKNICAKKGRNKYKGNTYPYENPSDLKVKMIVKNSKGQEAVGLFSPLFVNNIFYSPSHNSHSEKTLNVSYHVRLVSYSDFSFEFGQETLSRLEVDIFAEGVYDRQTGYLCMKGCRRLDSYQRNFPKNRSLDCEIIVNVQYHPLNGEGTTKGAIESTRARSDPFYFGPLELSSNSIYTRQAAQTVSRMDIESVMVLLSNTIACVFVGLQLYHVKKHPNVLPFISIVMLIILTLGHMIPLLLNFMASFLTDADRMNLYFDGGGWVRKNQVIVWVVTMIAFLFQTRLLQQTWSSRSVDEKKVVFLTLPLYIFGGTVTYFVYKWLHGTSFLERGFLCLRAHLPVLVRGQNYLWRDFKSYCGLIMDSFLLPQILFNLFFNSKENALAPSFYIGTTVVRLLPHAYDLYRSHNFNGGLDLSFLICGIRKSDLYSTAWDLVVSCLGLLFAGLVYLQQRFGGQFMVPKKYQESSEYQKVLVTNGVHDSG